MGQLKDKAKSYTAVFDNAAAPLLDEQNRAKKAGKIRAVLENEGVYNRSGVKILDIGCSFGLILKSLTPDDGVGIGVDIDRNIGEPKSNVNFARADAEHLPFSSSIFDVVICNHVYEHTDSPEDMLAEIERVLKPSGVCYFAGPNKFDVIEPHYGLPFLSWLPKPVAHAYVRLLGKGDGYPEKPYSFTAIKKLWSRFEVRDYTGRILECPERYAATDILPPGSFKRWFAAWLYRTLPFFFPGYVVVLKKVSR